MKLFVWTDNLLSTIMLIPDYPIVDFIAQCSHYLLQYVAELITCTFKAVIVFWRVCLIFSPFLGGLLNSHFLRVFFYQTQILDSIWMSNKNK